MEISCHRLRRCLSLVWLLVALGLAFDAAAAGPRRVLILHSFGRDFAPFDTMAAVFRTELARRSPTPIVFVEADVDFRRATGDSGEQALLAYLRARFDDAPPDLIVPIGALAARFHDRHRSALFPDAPVVYAGLDVRVVQRLTIAPADAVVAGKVDIPALIDNILRVLPETRTIAVVIGTTEAERFWRSELQREFAPYSERVRFEWLDSLSLAQMEERVAKLPPHSAILYALLLVDAAGVPHERGAALANLHAVANAPIFGLYESEIGRGVVGGPYTSQRTGGEQAAARALRALDPSGAPDRAVDIIEFESPVYDWRELVRWKIGEHRLPPDSEVRFRPPSIWEVHRNAVMAGAAALVLQAALITALLVQRRRRRSAEGEARGLAGRIVTAHEDERRRLARELHDDVTQRLAGLAIEAASLERSNNGVRDGDVAHSIREGLVELGADVHALSYRLHPSVIEDLGLVEALRIECDRIARQGPMRVAFDSRDMPIKVPSDTALCLFRVAQEALRNVERHARAKDVDVSVARKDGGVALAVSDNGAGFDALRPREQISLGLASMRERVRLLGGRLRIESARGHGTTVVAWVPMPEGI